MGRHIPGNPTFVPQNMLGASGITAFLGRSAGWLRAQRYIMGSVLGGLAVRIALEEKK